MLSIFSLLAGRMIRTGVALHQNYNMMDWVVVVCINLWVDICVYLWRTDDDLLCICVVDWC